GDPESSAALAFRSAARARRSDGDATARVSDARRLAPLRVLREARAGSHSPHGFLDDPGADGLRRVARGPSRSVAQAVAEAPEARAAARRAPDERRGRSEAGAGEATQRRVVDRLTPSPASLHDAGMVRVVHPGILST